MLLVVNRSRCRNVRSAGQWPRSTVVLICSNESPLVQGHPGHLPLRILTPVPGPGGVRLDQVTDSHRDSGSTAPPRWKLGPAVPAGVTRPGRNEGRSGGPWHRRGPVGLVTSSTHAGPVTASRVWRPTSASRTSAQGHQRCGRALMPPTAPSTGPTAARRSRPWWLGQLRLPLCSPGGSEEHGGLRAVRCPALCTRLR